jgi:hypothetical protein
VLYTTLVNVLLARLSSAIPALIEYEALLAKSAVVTNA